jgi:sortase A
MAAADVAQTGLRDGLAREWAGQPPARPASTAARPRLGSGFAILKIERIGVDQVLVEGADRVDLRRGPGHLPGSALPGQPGTMLVSGHRSTYGAPFFRLDELGAGDAIEVVTRDATYTYTVAEVRVLDRPGSAWALADEPGAAAGGSAGPARLALTTAHPRFAATRQLVVLADLTGTAARTDAP